MTVIQIISDYLLEHGYKHFCAASAKCCDCVNRDDERSTKRFVACKSVDRLTLPGEVGRTPIEIVQEYLELHGYDGLFTGLDSNEPCGCKKDDLAPCGQMWLWCHPGYYQEAGNGVLEWKKLLNMQKLKGVK